MLKLKLNSIRHFNHIFSNKNKLHSLSKIAYAIKPMAYNIPNDISGKDIFLKMIELTKDDNSLDFYEKITNKEKFKRNHVIGLMKNFIINKRIKIRFLYLSIFFFDILIKMNRNELSYEELGLGSLILITKFYSEKHFKNKSFRNFNKKEITSEELISIEVKCLKLLNYKFNYIHPIFFLDLLFLNGIVFTNDNIKTEDSTKVYNLSLKLLEYIMEINNEYIKYHPLIFSCGIVAFCRKKYNLHKWHDLLEKNFQMSFEDFSDVYSFVKEYYKEMKNHNNEQNQKLKSVSLDKSKIHFISKLVNKKYEEDQKFENEKKDKTFHTPRKYLNIDKLNEKYLIKTPENNNHKKKTFHPSKTHFNKNLLLENNTQNSLIMDENNIINNNSNNNKKNNNFNNYNNMLMQKSMNNEEKRLNFLKAYLGEKKEYSNKNTSRNFNYKSYILNNNFNSMSPNSKNSLNSNVTNCFNASSVIIKDDELNPEKFNASLENYKRFNHTLNNKIPNNLIERRVRNLSSIVNHLFSNHTNNIL